MTIDSESQWSSRLKKRGRTGDEPNRKATTLIKTRTLEVFVGALIAIGISSTAQAGEPSPVLVETTAFTEVDALTAGIGASLRKTE